MMSSATGANREPQGWQGCHSSTSGGADGQGYFREHPSFKVLEIFGSGDYLTEIGSWTNTAPDGSVADKGTYFSIFRKNEDGSYSCIRDMAVSSMPRKDAAEATEAAPAE
ncbi:MAG: hypothetical protein R2787_07065 [Saprospiraceae bacterium]